MTTNWKFKLWLDSAFFVLRFFAFIILSLYVHFAFNFSPISYCIEIYHIIPFCDLKVLSCLHIIQPQSDWAWRSRSRRKAQASWRATAPDSWTKKVSHPKVQQTKFALHFVGVSMLKVHTKSVWHFQLKRKYMYSKHHTLSCDGDRTSRKKVINLRISSF